MPLLSVVIPCYNEQECLPLVADALANVLADIDATWPGVSMEIVFVDDGSKDGTLAEAKRLRSNYARLRAEGPAIPTPEIRYVSFVRNFGKEAALYAGLEAARGDFVATMDADMQDPPALLAEMYSILQTTDADDVATRRATRDGEPVVRSFFARMFYRIINRISDVEIVDGARDFRLMRRSMVDAILSLKEHNRFSKGLYGWASGNTVWISYDNVERAAGKTKWDFWGLFRYSIEGIVSFSAAPLNLASVAGLVFCLVALVALVFVLVRALAFGDPVAGWPSLVCIVLFTSGVQMLCLGVMGQYIARMYVEMKDRPLYLVREHSDDDEA
jgi:glycosyltransferase involved in cell wall biosynthesis